MWDKLWFRIAAGSLVVTLVTVLLVALLANRVTTTGFRRYLLADQGERWVTLQQDLEAFYAAQGSWQGVVALLPGNGSTGDSADHAGQGQGQGQGLGRVQGGPAVRVLDAAGQTVASANWRSDLTDDDGILLTLNAERRRLGTLHVVTPGMTSRAALDYLGNVNRALVIAGAATTGLGLLLAVLLARQVTRPIATLSEAARAIASGDLAVQVPVAGNDELGQLGTHFNEMAQALASAEQQRRHMLADIAHELRTPISVIQGHLEAMLDGVFAMTPDNLEPIHEETVLLGRLVNDVRLLSLTDAGRLPLTPEAIDAIRLARQACEVFAPLADQEGIALRCDCPDGALPVSADPARLQQVLANLLANALRFAPRGSRGAPEVELTVRATPDRVSFAVRDNGPGLNDEQQRHVFDRFWRGDASRSRQDGGSGLGLAIARGLMVAHGGTLTVTSAPGAGATFCAELPRTSPIDPTQNE